MNHYTPISHGIYFQKQPENHLPQNIGCIVVAGGQGSRLHWYAPKGTYPISLLEKKSLFALLIEKVAAAASLWSISLPIAIMTSEDNDVETRQFFKEHQYFDYDPQKIYFFIQPSMPLRDEDQNLVLGQNSQPITAPSGNGDALKAFYDAEIWHTWKKQWNIEHVQFLQIDNPLMLPYDPFLVEQHIGSQAEVTIKCIPREKVEESVGVLVQKDGKTCIVEYFELAEEEKAAKLPCGFFKHPFANITSFCFSMDFVKKSALDFYEKMPLHAAKKTMQISGVAKNIYKYERFIFDVLPFAQVVQQVIYPREVCFAPLKNASGDDGPDSVRERILYYEKKILENLTGNPVPLESLVELNGSFYYPDTKLKKRLLGQSFTQKHISL